MPLGRIPTQKRLNVTQRRAVRALSCLASPQGVTRGRGHVLSGVWEATLKLVLWDIDHTLIATRGVGREIFGDAFEQVTGTPMREQAAVAG